MRLTFMGTAAFAVPSLRALHDRGHEIVLVVTQPDQPAGRGLRTSPPPVKLAAHARGLPILQCESVRDPSVLATLQAGDPEAIVVVAYGQILPPPILTLPPHGCLNLHASLLPRYRGAAPIPWAIMRGEAVTGVTVMQVERRMDAGPILLQQAEAIRPDDTTGTLGDRLAALGARLLCRALDQVAAGSATAVPQDERLATYAPKLRPEDTWLDWSRDARDLAAQVRALMPQPGATTQWGGTRLKVLEAAVEPRTGSRPGTVLATDRTKGLLVATGHDALWLRRVRPAGRRTMSGDEFARGARLQPGTLVGGRPGRA